MPRPWSAATSCGARAASSCCGSRFALWTGFTFVGFFTPIRDLRRSVLRASRSGGWETFWSLFYGFATYGNAGFLREQVCKYMCPYARFQSAMFDQDTLIISYDAARGEPRGARRRGAPTAQRAASATASTAPCACRSARPASTSARACSTSASPARPASMPATQVMDRIGYPRGLIRYTTQHALEHEPTHVLRPRVLVYGALLGAAGRRLRRRAGAAPAVALDVIRDRNALYRLLDDGRVENVYTLKILNKTEREPALHASA